MKMDKFEKKEPAQIRTWTELLVKLVRIVSFHNDRDPAQVPNA